MVLRLFTKKTVYHTDIKKTLVVLDGISKKIAEACSHLVDYTIVKQKEGRACILRHNSCGAEIGFAANYFRTEYPDGSADYVIHCGKCGKEVHVRAWKDSGRVIR